MRRKKAKQSNPVGRPKWIPTKEDLDLIEAIAGRGLTKEQMAEFLSISYDTLNERCKEYPEFSAAIKRAHSVAIYNVSDSLYNSAISGNTTAQIFWLKSRAGWKETQVNEHTGKDGAPIQQQHSINIKLTTELMDERISSMID